MHRTTHRRDFLRTTAGAATALAGIPYFLTGERATAQSIAKNDRPILGCIGTGSRWRGVGTKALEFADCAVVCDVDREHADGAAQHVGTKQPAGRVEVVEDYRRVLDRNDIDVVTIVTPDHWHSKIAIEAMQAGKDVYCEKPLTLTIDEGKQVARVRRETNRVFQVGTQQRSEFGLRFLTAVAMVKAGRIGDVKHVQCSIGGAPTSGPIAAIAPPTHLNWDQWLGQAPAVEYREGMANGKKVTRCHYEFRWWYEYSGGKMTDWGAHHVDIAQWAIGMEHTGPTHIEGWGKHPVPYEDGNPTDASQYNTATEFLVTCKFPNGVTMVIRHDDRNGILFEGTEGRIFVSRGALNGKPVEEMADNPLPEDLITRLYKGKTPGDHMRNFFECVASREQPISDVDSHHRALTTCHLANICIRLGRSIEWDPAAQQIVGDEQANAWQSRQPRAGFEIVT